MSEATRERAAPAREAPSPRRAEPGRVERWLSIFGSYGMAVALLLLLLVLTFLGTLEQVHHSLYDVQRKYFESILVWHDVGPIAVPLPGASLVMGFFALNLLIGGVIRMRKGRGTLGVLVAHLGVLFLFGSGLVETLWSQKGSIRLAVGEPPANEFRSYEEWELAIVERTPDGAATEWVAPSRRFEDVSPSQILRFTSREWPFDLRVSGWLRNSWPSAAPMEEGSVDGVILDAEPLAMEAERNQPGAYVTVLPKDGAPPTRGIVWGSAVRNVDPWAFEASGRRFEVGLRKRTWRLPFALTLKRFVKADHPGTEAPKEYSSYVTKHDGDVTHDVHVTMNLPMREEGYTLYQSGFDPNRTDTTILAVVKNPADRWPIWGCIAIGAGLLFHFGRKLQLALRARSRTEPTVAKAGAR